MSDVITYVGIDAHQRDLYVTRLVGREASGLTWTVLNTPEAVRRLVQQLERETAGPIEVFYEAGPGGYALQRQLTTPRVQCTVVAPALIPRTPGERVKTNRRDSQKLATLGRAGLLTAVAVPTEADEAVRDLTRARDDARADLQRCRHRLSKWLLRHGRVYRAGRAWTQGYWRWLGALTWPQPVERQVLETYRLALEQTAARLAELDAQIAALAETAPYRAAVGRLRCFRGIDTLTAMLILAELHDVHRFRSAPALMAYLGLVPSEQSTGDRHRRGPITKTGNTLVRRLLVEAAWHYQHRPTVGVALARRRRGQPAAVIAIADRAQQRLCRRFRQLTTRHKPRPQVAVAVARELAGFLWAALQPTPAAAV